MEMKSKAYWEVIEAALKDTDRAVPQPARGKEQGR